MQGTHRELFLKYFKAFYNFAFSEYEVLLFIFHKHRIWKEGSSFILGFYVGSSKL